jgi:hypothetical protein
LGKVPEFKAEQANWLKSVNALPEERFLTAKVWVKVADVACGGCR